MVEDARQGHQKIIQVDFCPKINSLSIFAPPAPGAQSAFVSIMQGWTTTAHIALFHICAVGNEQKTGGNS
jgi:hypothetical protein